MSLTLNKILVLCALLISAMLPGGHGQNLHGKTLQIRSANLTVPCPPPTTPAYPSTRAVSFWILQKTHEVAFTAKPSEFNADVSVSKLLVTNPQDREGDIIATPRWENQTPPAVSLVWADAATPDTLLDPQPVADRSFCAQGLAGRSLVAWRSLIPADHAAVIFTHLDGLSL